MTPRQIREGSRHMVAVREEKRKAKKMPGGNVMTPTNKILLALVAFVGTALLFSAAVFVSTVRMELQLLIGW
jgi:hypothetical protein